MPQQKKGRNPTVGLFFGSTKELKEHTGEVKPLSPIFARFTGSMSSGPLTNLVFYFVSINICTKCEIRNKFDNQKCSVNVSHL